MPIDGFGIGLYNQFSQTLDFDGYMEYSRELDFSQDSLANTHLLSTHCFTQQKPLLIADLPQQYAQIIPEGKPRSNSAIHSLIYLPLNTEKDNIGVITVQSSAANAYTEQHLVMLQHIANYTANALQKADSFQQINLQKEELEGQKQTIEQTYHQLKHTTEQLDKSIQYASHIQGVVMTEEADLRAYFNDLFILFRPKDVVSGDFYWFSQVSDNQAVLALADCTGHGVPGAFMSMLGATLLHDWVNLKKMSDNPAQILTNMHESIRQILKQDKEKNNDGMDISLCVFTKKLEENCVELIFSGAKSAMSYISGGEIYHIKGDKQYLGGKQLKQDFVNQHFSLLLGTTFYLYTDGYADQNNAERQKVGSGVFRQLLLENAHQDFATQQQVLESYLDAHQGQQEQRDDISVIGVRV
jgi:serine phosphatase RsbU (regulator of sigma subunit)